MMQDFFQGNRRSKVKYLVKMSIRAEVHQNGYDHVDLRVTLAPLLAFLRRYIPVLLIFLLLGGTIFLAASCSGSTVAFTNGQQVVSLNVEVARTPGERSMGLMGRTSLAEEAGMLFLFDEDTDMGFHMKNTAIPLSIAFIDAKGKILAIEELDPYDLTPVYSPSKYRSAIEVNRGWFEKKGIGVGDMATINY